MRAGAPLLLVLLAATLAAPAGAQSSPVEGARLGGPTSSDGGFDDGPADEQGILEQLNVLDRQLQEVRDQREGIQSQLSEVEASARRHEDEAASAEAQLAARRPEVRKRIGALYRLHRRGLARIVFGAEDPAELRRRSTYLMAVLRADLARMRQYRQAMDSRAQAQAAKDKDVAAMTALRAELQLREAELREQRLRRLGMLDRIRTERALSMRASAEYGQVVRGFDGRLAALGGAPAAEPPPTSTSGSFRSFRDAYGHLPWPTSGQLVRRFGPYVDPLNNAQVDSAGIELEAPFGTPFRAVFDGVVKLADFVRGYGQTVAIESGDYTTVYSHANGLKVRPGDRVRAGDVLGVVGNSGLTDGTGYVLGFEVRYRGTPQDPLPWLSPR